MGRAVRLGFCLRLAPGLRPGSLCCPKKQTAPTLLPTDLFRNLWQSRKRSRSPIRPGDLPSAPWGPRGPLGLLLQQVPSELGIQRVSFGAASLLRLQQILGSPGAWDLHEAGRGMKVPGPGRGRGLSWGRHLALSLPFCDTRPARGTQPPPPERSGSKVSCSEDMCGPLPALPQPWLPVGLGEVATGLNRSRCEGSECVCVCTDIVEDSELLPPHLALSPTAPRMGANPLAF